MALREATVAGDRPGLASALFVAIGLGGGLVGWWVGGLAASARTGVVQPNMTMVTLGVVLVVGVLIAVAGFGRDRQPVADAAVLEAAVDAPVLAQLTAPTDLTVLPMLEPGPAGAAAFDPLRRSVDRQIGLPRPLLVVLTGVTVDEIPVWVGANLAIFLAQTGRRVLLVDARLQDRVARPDASEPAGPGLVGVLTGADLAVASGPGPVAGLRVLPAGCAEDLLEHVPHDVPSHLRADIANCAHEGLTNLLSATFASRLSEVASDYEVVVALAPSLQLSRAAVTMAGTGLVVLTIPQRRVRANVLREHAAQLRDGGQRLLGVVLVSDAAELSA